MKSKAVQTGYSPEDPTQVRPEPPPAPPVRGPARGPASGPSISIPTPEQRAVDRLFRIFEDRDVEVLLLLAGIEPAQTVTDRRRQAAYHWTR